MSHKHIHPREEQVAELTRGQVIPFPPLLDLHLTCIAEVLARAWDQLLITHRAILLSGGETEVNTLMESRLNALLEEDKLWSQLVRTVTRGKETMSYDGSHLEKRPDLSVHLTNRTPSFPLVVECKLVDAASAKGTDLYCNQGLARFVRGEYAWATREAFMLAFVRDGSTILSCLSPFLAQSLAQKPDALLTEALPEMNGHASLHLARSRHNRNFRYIGQLPQNNPGVIVVWHLWLSSPLPEHTVISGAL